MSCNQSFVHPSLLNMPLLPGGGARWSEDEIALLEGHSIHDAASLAKENQGPLPYNVDQVRSKMRQLLPKPPGDAKLVLPRRNAPAAAPSAAPKPKPVDSDAEDDTWVPPIPLPPPTASNDKAEKRERLKAKKAAGAELFAQAVAPPPPYTPPPPKFPTPGVFEKNPYWSNGAEDPEEEEDDDDLLPFYQPPPPKRMPPPPQHQTSRRSEESSSGGWGSILKRACSPERVLKYPNAIEIDHVRRCPWIDVFIHKDWVTIFVFPIPMGVSVHLQTMMTLCYVVMDGVWRFPSDAPISQADALRSSRPNQFVFKIDLAELGVDVGSESQDDTGSNWCSFRFSRGFGRY